VTRLLTSFVDEDKFYGDNTEALISDIKIVAKEDPVFVLKLAAYARNVMHMRSVPVLTLALCSLIENTKYATKVFMPSILKRADEPADIAAIDSIFLKIWR